MKKALFAIVVMSIIFFTGTGQSENVSIVSKSLELTDFTAIQVLSSWDVTIIKSDEYGVEIQYSSNFENKIDVHVEGDQLKLVEKASIGIIWNENRILKAEIKLPSLKSLETTGSGKVVMDGFSEKNMAIILKGSGDILSIGGKYQKLDLTVNGSGNLEMRDSNEEKLNILIRGSGDISLTGGSTQLVSIRVEGSGSAMLKEHSSVDADVKQYGSGDIILRMEGGHLNAEVYGSGEIIWYGTVSNEKTRVNGSGEIRQG